MEVVWAAVVVVIGVIGVTGETRATGASKEEVGGGEGEDVTNVAGRTTKKQTRKDEATKPMHYAAIPCKWVS